MTNTMKTRRRTKPCWRAAAAGVLATLTASACAGGGFDGYRDGVHDSALAFDPN
jgi:hypothetical protein